MPGCTAAIGPIKCDEPGSIISREWPRHLSLVGLGLSRTRIRGRYIAYEKAADAAQLRTLIRAKPLSPSIQLLSQAAFQFQGEARRSVSDLLKGAGRSSERRLATPPQPKKAVLPSTRAEIQRLISNDERFGTFSDSCIWPDHPRQTASEHFVNLPRDSDGLRCETCPGAAACVVTAIKRDFEVLSSGNPSQALQGPVGIALDGPRDSCRIAPRRDQPAAAAPYFV